MNYIGFSLRFKSLVACEKTIKDKCVEGVDDYRPQGRVMFLEVFVQGGIGRPPPLNRPPPGADI